MNYPCPHPPKFLPSLNSLIEEDLSDASFSVKKMLRLIGMSRTDLHRKLDCSVGMSTSEYMRRRRLDKAAELLKNEPQRIVNHVSKEVGFENHYYFSKRFDEAF